MEAQVVTVFRSRLKEGVGEEYGALAAEISALAAEQPGYVSHKSFEAADGERVTIATFTDEASQRAWREHPRHREAQRLGRERYYETYSLQVCEVTRAYGR
ncbi:MAG TPA: antibiotic biosynthesis monooxygenase [Baekduia sp.]|nr:antibiotic biosynthesis monooxygenase [Baekduia sp.]